MSKYSETVIHGSAGIPMTETPARLSDPEGVGKEIRFEQSSSGLICPVKTTRIEPGYLCVAEDADIHQIANMQSPGLDLVTLHLYSPPLCRINTWKYAEATVEACEQEGAGSLYD